MGYYGDKRPAIIYGSELTISSFTDQGGSPNEMRVLTSTDHGFADSSYAYIYDSTDTDYNGFWAATKYDTDEFDIVSPDSGAATAKCKECLALETGDWNVYYRPKFYKDRIINRSPINGYVSSVDRADDDEKGRIDFDIYFYNLTDEQYELLLRVYTEKTVEIMFHEDNYDYTTPMLYTYVVTSFVAFDSPNYPVYLDAKMTFTSQEYEKLQNDS